MNKIKIALIGGSGFIGSRFIEIFKNTYDIRILDIKASLAFPNLYDYCDVREITDLRNNLLSNDIIINLAAEHHDNIQPISKYYETNTIGAKNICKVAKEKDIRKIIFTSTVAVYGLSNEPKSESSATFPFNDYGKSKLDAEKYYKIWQEECNTSLTIIRPTAIFGPLNRGNIYNLFNQIANDRFIMIGNGKSIKSIGYVDNLSHFISAAIKSDINQSRIYNFVDKPDLPTGQLVSIIRLGLNKKASQVFIPYFIAYTLGLMLDFLARLLSREFTISSIRIKKFCSSTVIESNYVLPDYKQVVTIEKGISKTLKYEFLNSSSDQ